ncbi:hypothetical protein PtA15_4A661 [Puccinia triticina]|uniref:Btz domain-containing protein n=1 Tax=Puccinia triticina TaxID=208348 RepID=A0ABY7CG52_9BASI|nr:uncharacterized protein PtA15_4A661 [Puccinia triticina]WAQ84209.1 hypothetical protein PtA15_4A661 [Puccinia triticina]WAR55035.1 hypothetical protein PtB15_4B654 [Puccinia triticina]
MPPAHHQWAPNPSQWPAQRPTRQRGQGRNGYRGSHFDPNFVDPRRGGPPAQPNPGNGQMVVRDPSRPALAQPQAR